MQSLGEFLSSLTIAFQRAGIRVCVIRNYEGFPDANIGNDIDLLIRSEDLPSAVRALRSLPGTRIVCFSYRPNNVVLTFIEGVSPEEGVRSIQIDLLHNFAWKGLPYLDLADTLTASQPRAAGDLTFYVLPPAQEAVNTLLAGLVVGGGVKEKYFESLQTTFRSEKVETLRLLSRAFGEKLAAYLTEAVIRGDKKTLVAAAGSLRRTFLRRSITAHPLKSLRTLLRHYRNEVELRFSPSNVRTISLTDMLGERESELAAEMQTFLRNSSKDVQLRAFDLHTKNPATADLFRWLASEWKDRVFGKTNPVIRIYSRYYDDFAVDPAKFGYTGAPWIVAFIAKLAPKLDLKITLGHAEEHHKEAVPARSSVVVEEKGARGDLLERIYEEIIQALQVHAGFEIASCLRFNGEHGADASLSKTQEVGN